MSKRQGRRAEPRIVDLATHPRRTVCLRVAAEFLDVDERTVRARIDAGELDAFCDARVCRIPIEALAAYIAAKRGIAS